MVRGLLDAFADGAGPERVTVLANRHVAAAYSDVVRGPVELHEVRSYRAGDRAASRAAAMALARLAPRLVARDVPDDLDVVHYPVTVPIPRVRAPTVVTLHDVGHHDVPDHFSAAERRYRAWAYDGAARAATLVVTPSEHARGAAAASLGLDPERIVAIPHGIDHDRFRPDGPALDDSRLPERFAFYPANLWSHKNHVALVEGLSCCADRSLHLVLTGSTYGSLDAVLDRARALGVDERVHHLGYLPADDVPALYRAATALVFPSLYEGFGSPPLEAMACGLPVAASQSAALREVCAGAALAFDPYDPDAIGAALDRITSDEPLREQLRAAGLERAREFDWSRSARAHARGYALARRLSRRSARS